MAFLRHGSQRATPAFRAQVLAGQMVYACQNCGSQTYLTFSEGAKTSLRKVLLQQLFLHGQVTFSSQGLPGLLLLNRYISNNV